MKRIILLMLLGFIFIPKLQAQTSVGGGLMFYGETALEAKADFNVSDRISVSPAIGYFLTDGYTVFMISGAGHYNLGDPESFNYYPLVGLNLISVSASYGGFSSSASNVGLELGGGATYSLSDSMKLYGEVKYIGHGVWSNNIGLSIGVYFSL